MTKHRAVVAATRHRAVVAVAVCGAGADVCRGEETAGRLEEDLRRLEERLDELLAGLEGGEDDVEEVEVGMGKEGKK